MECTQVLVIEAGVACEDLGPDLRPAVAVEVAEVVLDGNAAGEGLVEAFDAVGGEEEDALLVLEQPDEDADHGVALEVVLAALLHEDVGLVEQQDCVPGLADLEDGFEAVLEFVRLRAEFADVDHVERLVHGLGRGLGGERLADAGRPVHEEDEPAALALDEVGVDAALVADQQLQALLGRVGHDHAAEPVRVERDLGQRLDLQLAPLFRREAEAVDARLAVLQLLGAERFDRLSVLLARLVRVHFAERGVVDHDAAGCAQLVRVFARPRKLDEVARVRQLADLVGLPLEERAALGVRGFLLRRRLLHFDVLDHFEAVLLVDLEPLRLPNEVLAVLLDDAGSDEEELALARLDLRRALDFRDHGAALVRTDDVVAAQELVLELVLEQQARLPDLECFLLRLLEPAFHDLEQFVDLVDASSVSAAYGLAACDFGLLGLRGLLGF